MKTRNNLLAGVLLLILFGGLLFAVVKVDVKPIGPEGSVVGLASVNGYVKELLGSNEFCYKLTEYLGYASLLVAAGFGLLGLVQLIKRRSIFKVDKDLYLLGAFYILVIATYLLFEKVVINYRPVILDEGLEASFPSSHSMLVVAVMGTAAYQIALRVKPGISRGCLIGLTFFVTILMIAGRLLSGVHWFTDIVAGVILADAYVMLYLAFAGAIREREKNKD